MESTGASMPQQRSALPTAGGVLLIIAGVMGLIAWIYIAFLGGAITQLPVAGAYVGGILIICGVIGIIFSILALVGGIVAVQRKMWGLALAGSILGLFTLGFFFISSILSLIALILIAISRSEFK
jgi:hypothetical protein